MVLSATLLPPKPYKFLDAFDTSDAPIFFGRDREIRVLTTDVVVNRLVVLFADTGTGKTSLINAGVRPWLEDKGYATFFIRVYEDPVESARTELRTHEEIGTLRGDSLAEQLQNVVETLGRPIVLFFDQFEEFFIYVQDAGRRTEFIADVGRLYRNRDSGVHLIFSMREEFFVEMDLFREEIPTIFHNDSSLRLRPFDHEQARAAIINPARAFETRIEPALVEKLLVDLTVASAGGATVSPGRIGPAQLQIVCDALWRRRQDGRLTLDHYLSLGHRDAAGNVAQQVLFDRFEEAFTTLQSREELEALDALLPQLRTPENTKWIRDVASLVQALQPLFPARDINETAIRNLLQLLEQLRFIRSGKRGTVEVFELSHDYLVPLIDELQMRVRLIAPRRAVADAMSGRYLEPAELESILGVADGLHLKGEETRQLFIIALERGFQTDRWFRLAGNAHIWSLLGGWFSQASISGSLAHRGVEACGRLLETRVTSDERAHLFALMETALSRDHLTREAQSSLLRVTRVEDPRIWNWATDLLLKTIRERIEEGVLEPAVISVLSGAGPDDAVSLLQKALSRPDLTMDAQAALIFITSSPREAGKTAARVLTEWARTALLAFPASVSRQTVLALGELHSLDAVDVLQLALRVPALAATGRTALERAMSTAFPEVAERAKLVLSSAIMKGPSTVEEQPAVGWRRLSPDTSAVLHLDSLSAAIRRRACTVIVGPGIHWDKDGHRSLPTKHDLARRLADTANYPYTSRDDLLKVAQYVAVQAGRHSLVEVVTKSFRGMVEPSSSLRLLSRLDIPFFVTTNFDEELERALQEAGRGVEVVLLRRSHGTRRRRQRLPPLTHETAVVFKLCGTISQPESLLLTEDDFIDFTLAVGDVDAIPSQIQEALFNRANLMVGLDPLDLQIRTLFRWIAPTLDRYCVVLPVIEPTVRLQLQFSQMRAIESDLSDFLVALENHITGSSTER